MLHPPSWNRVPESQALGRGGVLGELHLPIHIPAPHRRVLGPATQQVFVGSRCLWVWEDRVSCACSSSSDQDRLGHPPLV